MSFSVKATHSFLKPPPSSQPSQPSQNYDYDFSKYLSEEEKRPQKTTQPTTSNQSGMAIRTVPSAQPDFM